MSDATTTRPGDLAPAADLDDPTLREDARDWRAVAAWIGAIGVGVLALAVSLWRLMPGIGFWDTAEFQTVLPVMGTAHPTGYPTYVLVGWLASVLLQPLGEPALRMNVLSAILVATGAAFTVDLARRLSGSVTLGVAAGIGIALTPILWAVGTHADPHALHFALLAIILWLLVRWEPSWRGSAMDPTVQPVPDRRSRDRWLIAAAVVVGLSVGNHSLTLLLGPPIVLFVLAVEPDILRRPRFVLANVLAFAIPTVLVRFEMVLRAGWFRAPFVYTDSSTWTGFWYVTLGAQFHGWLTDPFADLPGRLNDLMAMAGAQLGVLAPVVVIAFVVTAVRQPRYALLSGTTLVITCFFNSVYPDGAIDRYYIGPALLCWTWLAILGATVIQTIVGPDQRQDLTGVVPPTSAAPSRGVTKALGFAIAAVILLVPTVAALPVRSQAVDRSNDRFAQRWTDDVLSILEPNAVVVSWWSYSTPLWYATIVDGKRPDITIIDDRTRLDCNLGELDHVINLYLPTRPVYLVRNGDWELPSLEGRYRLIRIDAPTANNLIRVLPVEGGEGQPGSAPAPAPCAAIL
ncbi:MAG TPA: DUF2723 domain-containing protein [Candidatus Limnocylindrales bacterium]